MLLDASATGERIISLIRLLIYSLTGTIPFILYFFFDDKRPEVFISVVITSVAVIGAITIYWLVKNQIKTSLVAWITTFLDVSVITLALLLIALYSNPIVATNSLVVWQLYSVVIFTSTLRLNVKITIFAGVCALLQYALLAFYLDSRFELNELGIRSEEYGLFNWPIQFGRILILGLLTAVAVSFVYRTRGLVTFTGTDSLTGLKNRAYFEHILPTTVANAIKNHQPLSVAFVDFDHFKKINDEHGHAIGDKALQAVGDVFDEFSTDKIQVTRWGGEEFALLLENETKEEAAIIVNRINTRLKQGVQITDELKLKLQISAGITECPLEEDEPNKLIVIADDRMLTAKNTGRNKIIYK